LWIYICINCESTHVQIVNFLQNTIENNTWQRYELCIYDFIEFLGILQGLFPPGQGATIGVDFMIKTVEVENEKVKVHSLSMMIFMLYT